MTVTCLTKLIKTLPIVYKRAAERPTTEVKMCDVLLRLALPLSNEEQLRR